LLRDPEEWLEVVGDDRIIGGVGAGKTVGGGRGLSGTTRVMSHDFDLVGTEGLSARTIPYLLI